MQVGPELDSSEHSSSLMDIQLTVEFSLFVWCLKDHSSTSVYVSNDVNTFHPLVPIVLF